MNNPLKGKVALVTGAARGIGRACVHQLAKLGADVIVNDIDLASAREFGEELFAESVAEECRQLGARAFDIETDMRDPNTVRLMFEQIAYEFGGLDILINNAGGAITPMEQSFGSTMPLEHLNENFRTNALTTALGVQHAVIIMKKRCGGSIINMSSQAAVRVRRDGSLAHYSMVKASISHLTRILAAELGPFDIRVNAVAPGLILTSRAIVQLGRATDPYKSQAEAQIPLRRMGTPEDVAKLVAFLAGDESNYITGQVISVCGGNVLCGG